jgi:hypothetical protein
MKPVYTAKLKSPGIPFVFINRSAWIFCEMLGGSRALLRWALEFCKSGEAKQGQNIFLGPGMVFGESGSHVPSGGWFFIQKGIGGQKDGISRRGAGVCWVLPGFLRKKALIWSECPLSLLPSDFAQKTYRTQ